MKASELKRAQTIVDQIAELSRMRDRIAIGPVALMVGEGKEMGAVHLAPDYLRQIVADVTAGLDARVAGLAEKLREMGVDP